MKKTTLTNPIGILCIIVGLTGIASAHFQRLYARSGQLAPEGLPEIPAGLVTWLTNLSYVGILVNALVILAAVLFLLKKPYAPKWMYAALTISILFKILPLFFLNHYGGGLVFDYEWSLDKFARPAIDAVLLLGVWRISGGDATSAVEGQEPSRPASHFSKTKKTFSIIGWVAIAVPISLFALILYIGYHELSYAESEAAFAKFVPFLKKPLPAVLYAAVFSAILGAICGSIGMSLPGKGWKVANILLLIISVLCFLLFGFALL